MGKIWDRVRSAWQPLLIFLILSAGILAVGWLYSFYHLRDHRQDVFHDLEAVASLKENQINSWLNERMSDAQNVMDNPYIGQRVVQLFQEPYSEQVSLDRIRWMRSLQNLKQYQNVLLLDVSGRLRMQTGKTVHRIGPETVAKVRNAAASRQASFSDFYFCTECQSVHLDVFSPVMHYNPRRDSVAGVIILRIDPGQLLYPLIQQWPVPTKSAETYLVRREGGELLYLTELRFLKGSAAKTKAPLDRPDLPEVMAVSGSSGSLTGIDYRGEKVFAHVHNIPQAPWFIIAKIDRREAEAIAYLHVWLIGLITIAMILAAGGIIGFLWNRQQTGFFRRQYQLEKERQALSQHYEYLAKYANDIILLMDERLNIREANDKAVQAYGYPREALLTMDLHRLRQPGSRPSTDDQYRKAVDENGLVFETIHQRSDGSSFPVEVSARMIKVEDQKYFQAIIRDITERRRSQEALQRQKEELEDANQELLLTNRKLTDSRKELELSDEELRENLEKLYRSEEKYRKFLESAYDAIFIADAETGIIIEANQQASKLLGIPLERIKGMHQSQLHPPEEAERYREIFRQHLQSGRAITEDLYIRRGDGTRVPVDISASIIELNGRRVNHGVFRDISERRQAQESLRKSEEFVQSIIENSPIAIAVRNKQGRLLSYNPAWVRIWGMTDERIARHTQDIMGKTFRQLFDHLGPHLPEVEAIFAAGGSLTIPEMRIPQPHPGGAQWVRQYFYTIKDPQGGVDRIVILTDDITERKQAEQALRELAQRFEYVLGATQTGFDIIDKDHNIIYIDPTWKRFYGEAPGKKCFQYFMGREEICPGCGVEKALETKQVVVTQEFLQREERWVEVHTIPFQNEAGTWMVAEFNVDVTEHKKAQDKISAALKEKEVLLREIHHRVKNNLQVISSLLNLQSGYIDDRKSLELFRECQTRVRSMALIHERLYQTESLSSLSFSSYVQTMMEDLFQSYGRSSGEVTWAMDIDPSPIKIDTAIPCGLIVNELVSNSLKYGFPDLPGRGKKGLISIGLSREPDGSLALSVRDNGIGLPEGFDMEKVGSLGLQLVNTLVQQLDGRLEIKNDNGCSFRIVFPAG